MIDGARFLTLVFFALAIGLIAFSYSRRVQQERPWRCLNCGCELGEVNLSCACGCHSPKTERGVSLALIG